MAEYFNASERLVTVFGGSGFIGRHIVRAFAKRGWRVRVAVRRPDLAFFLQPIGGVGQVQAAQANLRYPESVAAAVKGAKIVINAAGVKIESGRQTYAAVHEQGSRAIAAAAKAAGADFLIHVSGIAADPHSDNPYIASKVIAEAATRDAFAEAIILRPSVVFGPEDEFFNRFGEAARLLPALPVLGSGKARLQPVFVGDVALAAASALDGKAAPGKIYELGGPEVLTLREVMQRALDIVERRRALIGIGSTASALIGAASEFAQRASLGLLPASITRDQARLLDVDNIVSAAAEAEARTLAGLGIVAQSIDAIVPSYLWRFRKTGQFGPSRFA